MFFRLRQCGYGTFCATKVTKISRGAVEDKNPRENFIFTQEC